MDYKPDKILSELEIFLKEENKISYFIYLFANKSSFTIEELLSLKVDDIKIEEDIVINEEKIILNKNKKREFLNFLLNKNKDDFLFKA